MSRCVLDGGDVSSNVSVSSRRRLTVFPVGVFCDQGVVLGAALAHRKLSTVEISQRMRIRRSGILGSGVPFFSDGFD